jgi:tRNA nucleotidyltransferase/poly(A) polymerase
MMITNKNVKDCIVKIVEKKSFVKDIFNDVDKAGGRILLVGGAVRDFFLGQESADLDFEVYALSIDELHTILKKYGQVHLIGKSFGVLHLSGLDADFSLPRTDSSGRRPQVSVDQNMSYEKAFRRRDVTVNAMGIDAVSYECIDPFGGLRDLQNKLLRAVDLALFAEDPLRLFRVMQLAARFECTVDPELSDLCRTMDIAAVSRERVEDEFTKLWLKAKRPSVGLRWLAEIGRSGQLFPEIDWSEKLYQSVDAAAEKKYDTEKSRVAFLWAIFFFYLRQVRSIQVSVDRPVSARKLLQVEIILQKYILNKDQYRFVASLLAYVSWIPLLVMQSDQRCYKWLAWWIRKTASLRDLAVLGSALFPVETVNAFSTAALSAGVLRSPEQPIIGGRDLVDHFSPGPELGELVAVAYRLQINESIPDKKKLLEKIIVKG